MTPPAGSVLLFSDDFDSAGLDTTKWVATTPTISGGYGQEIWDVAHVSQANSILQLQATVDLHSGELRSKGSWGYGYYECRLKLPASGPGIWPGFWMLTIYDSAVQQSRQEIDISEDDTSYPHRIGENLHWGVKDATAKHDGSYTDNATDFQADYHTYGCLYLPDRIEFYVNDVMRQLWAQPTPAVFFDPMQVRLSLSIFSTAQTYTVPPDGTTVWPANLLVDWVRVWQVPSSTPAPPPNGDITPPTVAITSPRTGATVVRHGTVTVTATATDDVGVARVEFWVNKVLVQSVVAAPYTSSFSTSGKPGAQYRIDAVAYDAAGNKATATSTVTAK